MGLRDRAQQHDRTAPARLAANRDPEDPGSLFDQPRWGIVDGELVEINGVTDVPGMSPAYLCSDGNKAGARSSRSGRPATSTRPARRSTPCRRWGG